jgi:hypothetical protein
MRRASELSHTRPMFITGRQRVSSAEWRLHAAYRKHRSYTLLVERGRLALGMSVAVHYTGLPHCCCRRCCSMALGPAAGIDFSNNAGCYQYTNRLVATETAVYCNV